MQRVMMVGLGQREVLTPRWNVVRLLVLVVLFAFPVAAASADTTGQRNQRYCEVIPSVAQGGSVTTYVYNTQGLNLCPAAQWDVLTEDEVNQEYGSQSAKLNGPRYWMLDGVSATGPSTSGETFTFGGIEASLRATIVTPIGTPTVGDQFYVPNTVQRQTVYTFDGGKPIYELSDPDGNVYVMQSYAQIYDTTLTIDQLPGLGKKLELPKGWHYRTRRPRHATQLTATGIAYVVNDDLANSYQLMNKPSPALDGVPGTCVRRAFKVTVKVGGDTADTRLAVGRRTIRRTTSNDFTVTVPVRPGAHSQRRRIAVRSRNDAGTARTGGRFTVCPKR